jgi:two-component system chemotaxis sensor kinase CheA
MGAGLADTLFVSERISSLEPTFHRLREVSRDTARRLGKEVRLHLSGKIADFDPRDLGRLQDALVQILQNAIDHGIEPVEIREKAGKPAAGQIWIEFSDQGQETIVSVRDDGAGVDLTAVTRKAIGLGLVSSTKTLPTGEALALLFQPGFSTKQTVTEVSGRGIGLDIVQATVDRFSGKVEIDTTRGKGTTIQIRFPTKNHAFAA